MNQEAIEQTRSLLGNKKLNSEKFDALAEINGLRGERPAPSGYENNQPFWTNEAWIDWAERTAVHTRTSATAGPPTRHLHVRASTINDSNRSFQAVVASEKPVPMLDFRSGELVDEILVASGIQFPDTLPLLDSHQRTSTRDIVGSIARFRREGSKWTGTGQVASGDQHADGVWQKVRDGHITSLSIGYVLKRFSVVPAGQTKTVEGRSYTASKNRALRVVVESEAQEISLVAVPADSTCKIRTNQNQFQKRSQNTMGALPTPAIHSRDSLTTPMSLGSLESAMMMKLGVNDPTRHRAGFDSAQNLVRFAPCDQFEQEAERAQTYVRAHLGEYIREALRLDGVVMPSYCGRNVVIDRAVQLAQQRGASTSNLSQMFGNVFGALFLTGYDCETDATSGWVSETDNLHLKPSPHLRPVDISPFVPRGAGAPAADADFEVVNESTQLGEYSAKFEIDEQDIINDSFGELDKITPQMMGQAAKRVRPDLVFSTLLANADMRDGTALFHADHSNLNTGSALGESTLEAAMKAMSQQSENGVKLNLVGRYLVVPQALSRTAAKLVKEVELINDENTPAPVVRTDNRLDSGVTDPSTGTSYSGDETSWYLSASNDQHGIECVYLKGTNRQPLIRTGFLKGGRFGVWFDVQHFIGCKAIDWRGLVKSTA